MKKLLLALVLSQPQSLMIGTDTNNNTQPVAVDTNGRVRLAGSGQGDTHGACHHTEMTIGTSSTACPPTPLASRTSLFIQLVTSSQNLRVTEDGTTPASTSTPAGVNIPAPSSFTDNLAGTVQTYCACDAASCDVAIDECP